MIHTFTFTVYIVVEILHRDTQSQSEMNDSGEVLTYSMHHVHVDPDLLRRGPASSLINCRQVIFA
jgi:hypothetical protein